MTPNEEQLKLNLAWLWDHDKERWLIAMQELDFFKIYVNVQQTSCSRPPGALRGAVKRL